MNSTPDTPDTPQNDSRSTGSTGKRPFAIIVALVLAVAAAAALWLGAASCPTPAATHTTGSNPPAAADSHPTDGDSVDRTASDSSASDSQSGNSSTASWLDAAYPLAAEGSPEVPHQPDSIVPRQHLKNGLIVNFWATWCPPCVRELPLFNRHQAQLSATAQPHAPVIAIAIDSPESVQRFLKNTPLPNLTVAVAGMEGIAIPQQAGSTSSNLPYTVVLDSTGSVVHQHTGELTAQQINQLQSFVQSDR